jgi:hypothetical protein
MEAFIMNHFKCPYNSFTCDYSVFFEDIESSKEKTKRWVECVDYQYVENPVTKKIMRLECEEFKMVVDGAEIVIKKGDLCVNNPSNWWEEYKSNKT